VENLSKTSTRNAIYVFTVTATKTLHGWLEHISTSSDSLTEQLRSWV